MNSFEGKAKPIPVPPVSNSSSALLASSTSPGDMDITAEANVRILSMADLSRTPAAVGLASSSSNAAVAFATPSTVIERAASSGAITPIAAILYDDPKRKKAEAKGFLLRPSASKPVQMFAHLQQWERGSTVALSGKVKELVHPAVVRLGLRFVNLPLMGAVERCRSMLEAFKTVIRDYDLPADQVISRHLEQHLKPVIAYLVQARPLAVSQSNAIRHLKFNISHLEPEIGVEQAKEHLIQVIDEYIEKRIDGAVLHIARLAADKIVDGDVVLTYARSTAVPETLLEAARRGRKIRVIAVDSKPFMEARDSLLPKLEGAGISVTYIHINAVGYMMREVTKVIVGTYCIFSNGTVMGRTGTAMVCQLGHQHHIPVIVVCETMKFSDRVQLDTFVFNELGNPEDLLSSQEPGSDEQAAPASSKRHASARASGPLASATTNLLTQETWAQLPSLNLLNVLFDVTPSEFITVVVCEVGLIPVTSIPVILREYNVAVNSL